MDFKPVMVILENILEATVMCRHPEKKQVNINSGLCKLL